MTIQQITRPMGRPTIYDPAFCEKIKAWGKLGKSRAWMCSQLEIGRTTMQRWEHEHEEFRLALTVSEAHAQAYWEDLGQDNISTREFQANVWSRSMAARFPKDWREKSAVVGGDEDDRPVQIDVSADAFTRRIAGLASRPTEGSGASETEQQDQG